MTAQDKAMQIKAAKFEGPPHFSYPFSDPSGDLWNMPLGLKLTNMLEAIRPFRGLPARDPEIRIWPVNDKKIALLGSDDMPVIFPVHNDLRMLRSFLRHYRSLGATRFLCMDDQSSDGSLEFLLTQDDVDVYHSNVRFKHANRGRAWREMLVAIYGKNRWYVNVDSDEYLFTGANCSLQHYTTRLKEKGIERLAAPMIDMIPAGKITDAIFEGKDDTMPWEVVDHFDGSGYKGFAFKNGVNIRGGARVRLFGAIVELVKYPLIYWDDKTSMGVTIHQPKPGHRNFGNACGCLLHFTIFSDVKKMVADATMDGQYFLGGIEYQRMGKFFDGNEDAPLASDISVKFEGEQQLVDLGFVVPA